MSTKEKTPLDRALRELIDTHVVREQAELQELLLARGYNVAQATLSRHLKRLKIAKVQGVYTPFSPTHPGAPAVLRIRASEAGLIVLHTHPGHAGSVASFIDQKYGAGKNLPEILGTIAGDDTILVIAKSASAAEGLLRALNSDFPGTLA